MNVTIDTYFTSAQQILLPMAITGNKIMGKGPKNLCIRFNVAQLVCELRGRINFAPV